MRSHRRYPELLAKFGSPEPAASEAKRASSLKAKMLKLTVIWRESETHEQRRESIEVLPSMTARGLKIYMAKLVRRGGGSGRSLSDLAATLEVRVEDKDHLHLLDLSDPHKDLAWLGISHEDTLHVSF